MSKVVDNQSEQQPVLKRKSRQLVFAEAMILLLVIVTLLIISVAVLKLSTGIAIILCASVAAIYGMAVLKISWDDMLKSIYNVYNVGIGAILILFMVGMLSASWLSSGSTPMIIYYGLKLISPSMFLLIAFLICAVGSMMTGSGGAVLASFGVALVGISIGLGIPFPLTAGALVAGMHVGDKWSPLSDVTNLAAAVTKGSSFDVFGVMIPTEVPGIIGASIIFFILGLPYGGGTLDSSIIAPISDGLEQVYTFNVLLLLPILFVIVLAVMKKPILPVLMGGVFVGTVMAVVVQKMPVSKAIQCLYSGYTYPVADSPLTSLLTGGGLSNMLSLMLVIFCAFIFAGIIEEMGMLSALLTKLVTLTKSKGSLVLVSSITTVLGVYLSSSVYVSLIVNGRMWKPAYEKAGMDPLMLARTLTEAGSISGSLVPYSFGALLVMSTIGGAWTQYMPYTFNHMISLACTIAFAYMGKFIKPYQMSPEPIPSTRKLKTGET